MDGVQNANSMLNVNDQTLVSVMGKQHDRTEIMVKQLQHSFLPTKEITLFNGDPLQYTSFIKCFEHCIEAKTDNDQDRLYYLGDSQPDSQRSHWQLFAYRSNKRLQTGQRTAGVELW